MDQEEQARHLSTRHSAMLYMLRDKLSYVLLPLELQLYSILEIEHHILNLRSLSKYMNSQPAQSPRIVLKLNFYLQLI
jgi:hypothetical protein